MSIKERISKGMKGLAKIAAGGIISILPLVNEGCSSNDWYNLTHCEPRNCPQPQRVQISNHHHFPPGIYTGSGSLNSDGDGITDMNEVQDLGKLSFRSGESIYILGCTGSLGVARIELIELSTGRMLHEVETDITSDSRNQIYTLGRIDKRLQEDKWEASLYFNGRKISRVVVGVLP